jgi:hypothetical protein
MTIFARNKHSIKTFQLVCNIVQNEATSDDDTVSILDCVGENLSEVESSNSNNEICDNQKPHCKSDASDSEQNVKEATAVVST